MTDAVPPEVLRALPAVRRHFRTSRWIPQQLDQPRRQRHRVFRAHQQPFDAMRQHPREAIDVRRHDRQSRSHRLEQHQPLALEAGVRRAKDVSRAVVSWQLVERHVAAKDDVTQAGAPYGALVAVEPSCAHDDQPAVRDRALDTDECPDQKA